MTIKGFIQSLLFTITALQIICAATFSGEPLAVVGITAKSAYTAEPGPTIKVAPGEFVLTRSGSTDHTLTVFVASEGTATPDVDYTALPRSVVFPVGEGEHSLLVQPISDDLIEGDETVVARIIPPLTAIVPSYEIDPGASSATVTIHDSTKGPSTATLQITAPKDGDVLPAGKDVQVSVVAVDPNGYISHVEFYADGTLIGVSDLAFFRAPDPGTAITHTINWTHPPAGQFALTARAVDSFGAKVISAPVLVTVKTITHATIEIISPHDGDVFSAGADLNVTAVAIDPGGYISHLEFYADDTLIGISNIEFFRAPDPGTPITHTVIWTNPPAGQFALTARALDSLGQKTVSEAVNVLLRGTVTATSSLKPTLSGVEPFSAHTLTLKMQGPPSQVYVLESSSDLSNWAELKTIFLPDGQLDFGAPTDTGAGHRFYRLRAH